jgi:hypothetical protein
VVSKLVLLLLYIVDQFFPRAGFLETSLDLDFRIYIHVTTNWIMHFAFACFGTFLMNAYYTGCARKTLTMAQGR